MQIIIINGPNLNLLGKLEPRIYVNTTFDDYFKDLKSKYPVIKIHYFQSNHEGDLIDKIQEVGFDYDGIVLNAGAFTHTSIALKDAISSVKSPTIEVHISNVYAREEYRHKSQLAEACKGVIAGLGLDSYELAIHYFINEGKRTSQR
jgi:3-dehydroquinate dehydratase-2